MTHSTTFSVRRWQVLAVVMAFLAAVFLLGIAPTTADASNQRVEVFIGFEQTPGPAEQALVRAAGGEIRFSYTIVPAIAAFVPPSALPGLERNPRVTYIEPVGTVHALDHPTGNAELDRAWGVAHIGSGAVHAAGNTGGGVRVAIIDTGIAGSHPDLAPVAGGRNLLNNNNNWSDDNGHGTHVAGSTCARANGWGVVGVAGGCQLYALKVLDSGGNGTWSAVAAAMDWSVANNIRVANLSLGGSGHPGTTVEQAFANAYSAGVVIVAAAGNSGNCGGSGNNVGYPARFSSAIAVAATNQNNQRPCFSSTGPDVEIAAPGVSILSTWHSSSGATTQLCNSTSSSCGFYRDASGTSMATPHVAGVAALVIAANPGITNVQVRATLANTAINIGPSNYYGNGLVSASAAVGVGSPPAPTTGTITGVVTNSSTSAAIAGASVSAGGISTTTASNGSYTLSGVPAGDQTLSASASGYSSKNQTVTVVAGGSITANVALDPTTGSISGVVTNSSTTAAIGGATVSVGSISTTTAGNGSYTLSGVPAGGQTLQVSAPGYIATSQSVMVVAGSTVTANVALTPEPPPPPGGTVAVTSVTYSGNGGPSSNRHLQVTIQVRDGNGQPVSGAAVSINVTKTSGGSGGWSGTGTTGTNGAVTIQFNNAMGGCFTSTVTSVTASGLDWNGATPSNGGCT